MQFEIVGALPEDIKYCAQMMAQTVPWKSFNYSVAECIPKVEAGKWLKLAKSGEELLGFISYKPQGIGSMSSISLLCIAPEYKHLGIGTALLKHAEEHIFASEHNIVLFVTSFNHEAINFYEKHGYRRVGEIENYNLIGQSEYLYRKTTGPRR